MLEARPPEGWTVSENVNCALGLLGTEPAVGWSLESRIHEMALATEVAVASKVSDNPTVNVTRLREQEFCL